MTSGWCWCRLARIVMVVENLVEELQQGMNEWGVSHSETWFFPSLMWKPSEVCATPLRSVVSEYPGSTVRSRIKVPTFSGESLGDLSPIWGKIQPRVSDLSGTLAQSEVNPIVKGQPWNGIAGLKKEDVGDSRVSRP